MSTCFTDRKPPLTLLQKAILDSLKPKEFADDYLNFMKIVESSPKG